MSLAPTALASVKQDVRPSRVQHAYYLAALLPVVGYLFLGNARALDEEFHSVWPNTFAVAQFLMLLFPFFSSLVSVTSLLAFGAPRDRRPGADWRWNPDAKLVVAYVSRGHQPRTLHRASSQTQDVLDQLGVFYELELVTDIEIASEHRLLETSGKIFYYQVSAEYQTPRGARFKARALQYLLEQRTIRTEQDGSPENLWVLHLDEESIVTPECVLGMLEHMEKYDLRRTPGAIGQGEIQYNSHGYGDHVWIAAIDAGRTGGDLGLFRAQYKTVHKPLVGMHGSYVLVPAKTEQEITWDVGGHGSVTEDSYFALMAMQRGVPFDWVEGFIREQSPFTIWDIIRQRRRWFCGLSQVARDPSLNFLTTITLRVHVWFWAFSALALPLSLLYLQQWFVFGSSITPYWLFVMASLCMGFYAAAYIVGAYRNLQHCKLPFLQKAWIMACAVVAWFFFIPALAECSGTLYGMFFPVTTFYVVAKDGKQA